MGVNIEALAKKKPLAQTTQEVLTGAPEGTRTPDLLVRSQSLYPAELQAHSFLFDSLIIISHLDGKVNRTFSENSNLFFCLGNQNHQFMNYPAQKGHCKETTPEVG